MNSREYLRRLWDGRRNSPADRIVLSLLLPLSLVYGAVMQLRALAYANGVFASHRLPRPVISVGNLTVGGTGKTPMVAHIARWFMARGKRVAVLTRGYGGSLEGKVAVVSDGARIMLTPAEAGDEPCLLASSIPGLMVIMGTDRYRAGCLAMETLGPDIFILDDGYQHQRLKRDLNLLLMDGRRPFGNGRSLPAGELRESPQAADRADLIIYTRCTANPPPSVTGKPRCSSFHRLTRLIPMGGGAPLPLAALQGQNTLAFAGIADPSSFFDSLEMEGVRLGARLPFPDHACYGDEDIEAIVSLKESAGCDCLVTTEKDMIKLAPFRERLGTVYTAEMQLSFIDPEPLELALEGVLRKEVTTAA